MKKKLAILLSVLVAAASFAGCSPAQQTSQNPSASPDASPAADTSWEKVEQAKKLVVGLDIAFPPMGFQDEAGNIVGYDIDLANAVCEDLGIEAELKAIDWSMKEQELNTGKIDVIWNGYTITDERKEMVDFTPAYLANRQIIITMADSAISKKADLAGIKIGVQAASTAIDAMAADPIYEQIKDAVNEYPENASAMLALETDKVQAVVVDEVVGKYYLSKNEGKFKILEENFGEEEYGIGVRKGDKALAEKIASALKDLKANGKAAEISIKWFGEDISK